MRLLDTWTGQFVEKDPRDPKTKYAILSHTWDSRGEQTYEDLKKIQKRNTFRARNRSKSVHRDSFVEPLAFAEYHPDSSALTPSISCEYNVNISGSTQNLSPGTQDGSSSIPFEDAPISSSSVSCPESQRSPDSPSTTFATPEPSPSWSDPALSPKIREACKVARERGFLYIWIDSCCIDKSSSSELSEAINSMYYWYSRAEVCYAFLADVPAEEDPVEKDSHFRRSRWFTRGWTLQELIAPVHVVFFSDDWTVIGSKSTLAHAVTDVTNIDRHALLHVKGLETFSVAQRFSWAAGRKTTRVEDRAYSLLGLFDLNMPTLYGEGDRSFRRLQEEILRRVPDQSLFAWTSFPLGPSMAHFLRPNHTARKKKYVYSNGSSWDTSSSLFASSPDAFAHCGGITVVDPDQVLQRLQPRPYRLGFDKVTAGITIVPRIVATHNYVFSPHGVQTQIVMIPFSCYLLSSCNDLPPEANSLSTCYLVFLACEHKDFPRRLLARPCFVSRSTLVPLLRCGSVSICSKGPGGPQWGIADLLPISHENIQHMYQSSGHRALLPVVRSVYLDYPGGADEELEREVARRQPHETITLMLSPKSLTALDTRGYRAKTRSPYPAHPSYHSFTFSNHAHTITIRCRHNLEGDAENQRLTIESHIRLSGTLLDDTSRELHQADGRTTPFWTGYIPWSSSLGEETVVLHVERARTMSLQLNLAFVAKDHYSLEVAISDSVQMTTSCCPHPLRQPPLGALACKAAWRKLKDTLVPVRLPALAGFVTRIPMKRTVRDSKGEIGEQVQDARIPGRLVKS